MLQLLASSLARRAREVLSLLQATFYYPILSLIINHSTNPSLHGRIKYFGDQIDLYNPLNLRTAITGRVVFFFLSSFTLKPGGRVAHGSALEGIGAAMAGGELARWHVTSVATLTLNSLK